MLSKSQDEYQEIKIPNFYKESMVYQQMRNDMYGIFQSMSDEELLQSETGKMIFTKDKIEDVEDVIFLLQSLDYFVIDTIPDMLIDYIINGENNEDLLDVVNSLDIFNSLDIDSLYNNFIIILKERIFEIKNYTLKYKVYSWHILKLFTEYKKFIACGKNHITLINSEGNIIMYGNTSHRQMINIPRKTFSQVACGEYHSVGIETDGTVDTWGDYFEHQNDDSPSEDKEFTYVICGKFHNVGIRKNKTIYTWGGMNNFQRKKPSKQTFNKNFKSMFGNIIFPQKNSDTVEKFNSVVCGGYHSVGIREDNTIVIWGDDSHNQRKDTPIGEFLQVACGLFHSVGIRKDGTVVTWGGNAYRRNSPEGKFLMVACGKYHNVGIKEDGTIVTWGSYEYDDNMESPDGEFVYVTCGAQHSVAVRKDGSVVTWGKNNHRQLEDSPSEDIKFLIVTCGENHSCGITTDGNLVIWGDTSRNQADRYFHFV